MTTESTTAQLLDHNGRATDFYRGIQVPSGTFMGGRTTLMGAGIDWPSIEMIDGHFNGALHVNRAMMNTLGYSLEYFINHIIKLHKTQSTDSEIMDSVLKNLIHDEMFADTVLESLLGMSCDCLVSSILEYTRDYILENEDGWDEESERSIVAHVAESVHGRNAIDLILGDRHPELYGR